MLDIWQLRMCSSQALSLISWMINQASDFPFCIMQLLVHIGFCFVFSFAFVFGSRMLVEKEAVVFISWQNGKKQKKQKQNKRKAYFGVEIQSVKK